jgi:hypothetical protein
LPFTGETILQVKCIILELRYNILSYLSMWLFKCSQKTLARGPL